MAARLGILGAGKLGTTVARLGVNAGRIVAIADARTDPMIDLIVSTVAPGARLTDAAEVLATSDIVLLAIPYSRLADLDLDRLSRVVVIDATNPWLETDGQDPPPSPLRSNSRIRLVRSLNHLAHEDLGAFAAPPGAPFRTAVAVSSDDSDARSQVAALVDDLGFDPVEMEARNAWLADVTGPFFGRRMSIAEMSAMASASRRANRLTW
ncbi:MAG: NADPH-dependent F420 reductase [Propionibacteriaceae bacterium]